MTCSRFLSPTGGALTHLAARLWPQARDPCRFEPPSFCHCPLPKTGKVLSKSPSSNNNYWIRPGTAVQPFLGEVKPHIRPHFASLLTIFLDYQFTAWIIRPDAIFVGAVQ